MMIYDNMTRTSTLTEPGLLLVSHTAVADAFACNGFTRQTAVTASVGLARSATRDPHRQHLVTGVSHAVAGGVASDYRYAHDLFGRATSRDGDPFGYNARSEVTAADIQFTSSRYAYDTIGNNIWTASNATTNTYTANALNQYTAIDATTLAYDADGNMLTNGLWFYTRDCENRLTAVFSNSICIVSNAYDHQSRRVQKITPNATHTYIYDGWNLIQETIENQQSTIINHYIWGKDLSGTLQGAGGVSGLLAVSINGTHYFPFYDNNGNITAYVDESGSISATYTYDAFGRTIAQSGSLADSFPHRFSTKYYDPETGLYYYGYRFYAPELIRWLNRDPIEEQGGGALYCCVRNNLINARDYLGLAIQSEQIGEYTFIVDANEEATGVAWQIHKAPWNQVGVYGYVHPDMNSDPTLAWSGANCHSCENDQTWGLIAFSDGKMKLYLRILKPYKNTTIQYNNGKSTTLKMHEWDHVAHLKKSLELRNSCLQTLKNNCVCKNCETYVLKYAEYMLHYYYTMSLKATLRMDELGGDDGAISARANMQTIADGWLRSAQILAKSKECFKAKCEENVGDESFPITYY